MPSSLQVALQNQTSSSEVYAYITGIAIQNNGARVLIKANGDPYYPVSPSAIGSALAEDCAIPLGHPGNTVTVTIPQIAGGRIWFSCDGKLTFLLNPGPALVEPSVLNPSDPNALINFGFCEFTLNNDQLFANISYVDFASALPVALTLQNAVGEVQHVSGMQPDGLDKICNGLRTQAQKDNQPWDKLIVQHGGKNLRALNPTHGGAVGGSFDGYYEPYVEKVWKKYQSSQMRINTQAGPGIIEGSVNSNGELVIGNESFSRPNTADIFGCNSGPFTTGPSPDRNAIIPRLAAAFVRSTLLVVTDLVQLQVAGCNFHVSDIEGPRGRTQEAKANTKIGVKPSDSSTYYKQDPTNHYARIVHETNLDKKGYAFAYDDVQPDGGSDQSGKVNDGNPTLFTITVGGNGAYGGNQVHGDPSQVLQQQQQQRQKVDAQTSMRGIRGLAQRIFK